MTIRIIDDGPDPKVVRQVVCHNCGVKVEYTPSDVKLREYRDYDGGSDTHYWIDCPKCNKEITARNH